MSGEPGNEVALGQVTVDGPLAPPAAAPRPGWWRLPSAAAAAGDIALPEPFFDRYSSPEGYDPGDALISAVNVALLLGQPLLLTGEPGCGKTSLAYWLARNMGVGEPLVQVVKSTTSGRDLLYSFDEIARFRDAYGGPGTRQPEQFYLDLNALGRAILFSKGPDGVLKASGGRPGYEPPLHHRDLFRGVFPARRRQVVLIDELDKAPRDTPNDLLSEIERMEFSIPEVGVIVGGDRDHRPVVVITSNSDKSLPEPFLRRCVYHHIPAPDKDRRAQIVARRQTRLQRENPALFEDAMAQFERMLALTRRDIRAPGTAELLAWLDTIAALYPPGATRLDEHKPLFAVSIATLGKTREDSDKIVAKLDLKAPGEGETGQGTAG